MTGRLARSQSPLSVRRVFAALAIAFGVVFAVNGVFAYLAISSFSGVDGEDSYRHGLDYNATIAAAQRQAALGWSANLVPLSGRRGLDLTVADKSGAPLTGLSIKGVIARPSTDRFDRPLAMLETAPGHYEVVFSSPIEPGNWVADLAVAAAEPGPVATQFQMRQRLWLK